MSDDQMPEMPSAEIQQKLGKAAEIVTRNLDKALEECSAEGLTRDMFDAAVVGTLVQAVETSYGSEAPAHLREIALMIEQDG